MSHNKATTRPALARHLLTVLMLGLIVLPATGSIWDNDRSARDEPATGHYVEPRPSVTAASSLDLTGQTDTTSTTAGDQPLGPVDTPAATTAVEDPAVNTAEPGQNGTAAQQEAGSDPAAVPERTNATDEGRWISDGHNAGEYYSTHRKLAYRAAKYLLDHGYGAADSRLNTILTIPAPGEGWRPVTREDDVKHDGDPYYDDGLPTTENEDRTTGVIITGCQKADGHDTPCFYRYDADLNQAGIQVYAHWILEAYASYPDIIDKGIALRNFGHGYLPNMGELYQGAGYAALVGQNLWEKEGISGKSVLERLSAPGNAKHFVEKALMELNSLNGDSALGYYYLGLATHYIEDAGTIMHVGFTAEQILDIPKIYSKLKQYNLDTMAIHNTYENAVNGPNSEGTQVPNTFAVIDQLPPAEGIQQIDGAVTKDDATMIAQAVINLASKVAGPIKNSCVDTLDTILPGPLPIANGERHCRVVHAMLLMWALMTLEGRVNWVKETGESIFNDYIMNPRNLAETVTNKVVNTVQNGVEDAVSDAVSEVVVTLAKELLVEVYYVNTILTIFPELAEDVWKEGTLAHLTAAKVWRYVIAEMALHDLEDTLSTLIGIYDKVLENILVLDLSLSGKDRRTVTPGGLMTFKLGLANYGDKPLEVNLNLTEAFGSLGWSYYIANQAKTLSTYTLAAKSRQTLYLRVTCDKTEGNIEYGDNSITLKATSGSLEDTLNLKVKVKEPNLVAREIHLSKTPVPGEQLMLSGTVLNGGGVFGVAHVKVHFYDRTTRTQVGQAFFFSPQEAWESKQFRVTWTVPDPVGLHEFQLIVDGDERQEESNEYDNQAVLLVGWGPEIQLNSLVGEQLDYAVDSRGILHVVTTQYTAEGLPAGDLRYYRMDQHGNRLLNLTALYSNDKATCNIPSLKLNSQEEAVILWTSCETEMVNGQISPVYPLYLQKVLFDGTFWATEPKQLVADSGSATTLEMALDSEDELHVTWVTGNKIHYGHFSADGVTISTGTPVTTYRDEDPDKRSHLQVDEAGEVRLLVPISLQQGGRGIEYLDLKSTGEAGSSKVISWTQDQKTYSANAYPVDMVVDGKGVAHLLWSYRVDDQTTRLLYGQLDSDLVLSQVETLTEVSAGSLFAQLEVDDQDEVTVVWSGITPSASEAATTINYLKNINGDTSKRIDGSLWNYGHPQSSLQQPQLRFGPQDALYVGWLENLRAPPESSLEYSLFKFKTTAAYPDLSVMDQNIHLKLNDVLDRVEVTTRICSNFWDTINVDYSIYSTKMRYKLDSGTITLPAKDCSSVTIFTNFIENDEYVISINEKGRLKEPTLMNNLASKRILYHSYPVQGGSPGNGGMSYAPGTTDPLHVKWEYKVSESSISMPVIAEDRVVVASQEGQVAAFSTTGQKIWQWSGKEQILTSPTLIEALKVNFQTLVDGKVLVPTKEGTILGFHLLSGQKLWESAPQVTGSVKAPLTVADDMIFVGTTDGKMYALDLDTGRVLWKFTASGSILAKASYNLGRLGFGTDEGRYYLLEAGSGKLLWEEQVAREGSITGSGLFYNGTVFVQTTQEGQGLVALDMEDGSLIWASDLPTGGGDSPALGRGLLLVSSASKDILALDPRNGKLKWKFVSQGEGTTPPVVNQEALFIASKDGNLYSLGLTKGQQRWSYAVGKGAYTGLSLADERLFVTTAAGRLYCLMHNHAPVAQAAVKKAGVALETPAITHWNDDLSFTAAGSSDQDDEELTYTWLFEPSGGDSFTRVGEKLSLSFDVVDGFTVTLTVSDGDLEDVISLNINTTNTAPVAMISSDTGSTTGLHAEAIQFHSTGSKDPDGDELSYLWDFGDGGGSSRVEPVHAFSNAEAGIYTVTLVVSDGNMESEPVQLDIKVLPRSELRLTTLDDLKVVAPGSTTVFMVMVENRGNVPLSAIQFEIFSNDYASWVQVDTLDIELLEPFKSKLVTVEVEIPTDVEDGLLADIGLQATATESNDQDDITLFCDIDSEATSDLDLMVEGPATMPAVFEPVTGTTMAFFIIFLENTGDMIESFTLSLQDLDESDLGWSAYILDGEILSESLKVEVKNGDGVQVPVMVVWDNADDRTRIWVDGWVTEDPDINDTVSLTALHA